MERTVWNDQRLDDRFDHVDRQLGEMRADIRGLRVDMEAGFREMRGELTAMRRDLHTAMLAMLGATIAALVAIAASAF